MIFIKLEKPVNQPKTIHFDEIQQDRHLLWHFLENKQLKPFMFKFLIGLNLGKFW